MIPIDYIRIETPDGWHMPKHAANCSWNFDDITVEEQSGWIVVQAETSKILRLQIGWYASFPRNASFMGDAFERGYGDIGFNGMRPDEVFHWYFCVQRAYGDATCWGVRTNPNAWCAWTICPNTVDLWLDVRNGDYALDLQGKSLKICEVIIRDYPTDSYSAVQSHCRLMASECKVRNEISPVVGYNDWYYAYGGNSPKLAYQSASFLKEIWPQNSEIEPWVVIDDGWQCQRDNTYNGGPWDKANNKFQDMKEVADHLKEIGVHPGIWFRPLLAKREDTSDAWILHDNLDGTVVLDPSHSAVQQKVYDDVACFVTWGYEMVKHDFTTYDILGCWGVDMTMQYQSRPLNFYGAIAVFVGGCLPVRR